MADLTREQVASYSRRRRWALFPILIWPPLGIALLMLGVKLLTLTGIDRQASVLGAVIGLAVMIAGSLYVIHLLVRCPSCHAFSYGGRSAKGKRCESCDAPLTLEAFDESSDKLNVDGGTIPAKPDTPVGATRHATEQEIRDFYGSFRLTSLFIMIINVLAASTFIAWLVVGDTADQAAPTGYYPLMFAMVVSLALIVRHAWARCACPHCGSRAVIQEIIRRRLVSVPKRCPRCEGRLKPLHDAPEANQEKGVPYGRKK